MERIFKVARKLSNKFIHSIAFIPAIMGVSFLALAILCIELDNSGVGNSLNEKVRWLTLKDAATARTIIATVAAGIISLTVFSFSMVMVVMNQAASQMSNRMLDNIIGDRVQKIVLGFYVGTIVFSLFLLTTISEAEAGSKVPALSVYVLLFFTVLDIFLFVYFLHYITQSFRYEQLIQRIHNRTYASLQALVLDHVTDPQIKEVSGHELPAIESGYFQGFALKRLLAFAKKHDLVIRFLHTEGTYILRGTPFLSISAKNLPVKKLLKKMFLDIDFYYGQEIDNNPYYGFQHLMEVGIKALSPGINDPGTAVLSLNALADLLAFKMYKKVKDAHADEEGTIRIITKEMSFEELFDMSVAPIWDYGKKDRIIQAAFRHLMAQLQLADTEMRYVQLFNDWNEKMNKEQLR
jgi:uncharacterized membrane protein